MSTVITSKQKESLGKSLWNASADEAQGGDHSVHLGDQLFGRHQDEAAERHHGITRKEPLYEGHAIA